MFIESASQLYLGKEMTCAHIVADKTCTWRFWDVLDKDDDYAFQWVAKANGAKTVTIQIGDQETTFDLTQSFTLFKHVFEAVRIANHPYLDVTFPEGEFFIGRTQLEHGTIVTDWQRSQDDDKNSITSLWSALEITAEEIRAEVHAAYHVTNLVPTVYSRQHSSGDEWTPSSGALGLKWTTNSDGSVTAEALTSGVATTGQSAYAISGYTLSTSVPPITLDTAKQYTITGCPAGGSASTYYVRIRLFAENETPSDSATFEDDSNQFYDYGDGLTLQAGWAYVTMHLVITSGYTIPDGGITFWPMIVEGTEQYPYVPAGSGDTSMWSVIKQNAGKISLVVDSDNNINAGEIALAINSAGSEASISANKIGLSGDVIDLTGKNIRISSTNFSVSADGTISAASANITGGTINIETSSESTDKIILRSAKAQVSIQPNGYIVTNTSQATLPYKRTQVHGGAIMMYGDGTQANIDVVRTQISQESIWLKDSAGNFKSVLSDTLRIFNSSGIEKTTIYPGYQYFADDNGTSRVALGQNGLFFYDSTGSQSSYYPAEGFTREYEEADNVEVLDQTWKTLGYHYFQTGRYIIEYVVGFPGTSSAGYRYSIIADHTTDDFSDVMANRDTVNAVNGRWTYTRIVHLYSITTAGYKYFRCYQNSGVTLSCSLRVYIIKLP